MFLFLDTEFTQLDREKMKLVSIALVQDEDTYFYAELSDTYAVADCSDFVKLHVLPLLTIQPEYRVTLAECAVLLTSWLSCLLPAEEELVIFTDAPSWDIPHLQTLFNLSPPSQSFKVRAIQVSESVADQIITSNGWVAHNALTDAHMLRIAHNASATQ